MPIHINLLAEAQYEEDLRRRDPVKRGIWFGCILVGAVLLWSLSLQIRIMAENSRLKGMEKHWQTQSAEYHRIQQNEKDRREIDLTLADLTRLGTNRFLWGSLLNSLQHSTLEDVQLTRFRSEQAYIPTEEVKSKTNESGRVVLGRPGYVTEKTTLWFDAKDSSAAPGDQVAKFKEILANAAFFQRTAGKSNEFVLRNLSAPAMDGESGKAAVMFSLECRLPERTIN